jgi:NADP-dependent aldehyde dehydrogenase
MPSEVQSRNDRQILGEIIIGTAAYRGAGSELYAYAAHNGERLLPSFGCATMADIDSACELAEAAFNPFQTLPIFRRADFLDQIADNLIASDEALVERAHLESGLPKPQLSTELACTANQIRFFAVVLREGRWQDAAKDSAEVLQISTQQPDLRQRYIPLGPAAIFGAGNLPFASSVAGVDTTAALAAGCPVIVKAHPGHLGTSELVARAVRQAAIKTHMPDGVFSLVTGEGNWIGAALIGHPAIQAVGFTGSRQGGLSILRLAKARSQPIPVFAKMRSINPVILMPSALATRGDTIATDFVNSFTTTAGQFCTKPGVAIAIEGLPLDAFCSYARSALRTKPSAPMLSQSARVAYCKATESLSQLHGVTQFAQGLPPQTSYEAQSKLFRTSARAFLSEPSMAEEIFGPVSLVIGCRNADELASLLRRFGRQLTATLHLEEADFDCARQLLPIIEGKTGKIVVNNFLTGVGFGNAVTDGDRSVSFGATAISRFVRPVCYQNIPAVLLRDTLADESPSQT